MRTKRDQRIILTMLLVSTFTACGISDLFPVPGPQVPQLDAGITDTITETELCADETPCIDALSAEVVAQANQTLTDEEICTCIGSLTEAELAAFKSLSESEQADALETFCPIYADTVCSLSAWTGDLPAVPQPLANTRWKLTAIACPGGASDASLLESINASLTAKTTIPSGEAVVSLEMSQELEFRGPIVYALSAMDISVSPPDPLGIFVPGVCTLAQLVALDDITDTTMTTTTIQNRQFGSGSMCNLLTISGGVEDGVTVKVNHRINSEGQLEVDAPVPNNNLCNGTTRQVYDRI